MNALGTATNHFAFFVVESVTADGAEALQHPAWVHRALFDRATTTDQTTGIFSRYRTVGHRPSFGHLGRPIRWQARCYAPA